MTGLTEVRLGELTAKMPKATPNNNPFHENDTAVDLVKPKSEAVRELGFSPKQVERLEKMARHPEIVEQAKAEALEAMITAQSEQHPALRTRIAA